MKSVLWNSVYEFSPTIDIYLVENFTNVYNKSVELSIKYSVLSEMTAFLLIANNSVNDSVS